MAGEFPYVGKISEIRTLKGPGGLSGHVRVVCFANGQSAFLDASTAAGAMHLSALEDLQEDKVLAYVDADREHYITQVLAPFTGCVRDLKLHGHDLLVEMEVAASHKVLKPSHPRYRDLRQILETAFQNHLWVALTVNPGGHEVLDVCQAEPDEDDLAQEPPSVAPSADPSATISPVSMATATAAFASILTKQCNSHVSPKDCIAFRYPDEYCQGRAHKMAGLLSQFGVESCKLWAYGPITARTADHPDFKVTWTLRHVAPAVRVVGQTSSELMIFDPTLFENGPVRRDDWVARLLPAPSSLRPTETSVFDQPVASSPSYDFTLAKTNKALAAARTAFKARITVSGAPPYAHCMDVSDSSVSL